MLLTVINLNAARWTGTVSNDWDDPANWENNDLPGATDFIFINAAPYTAEIWESMTCRGFKIEDDAFLYIGSTATVTINTYTTALGMIENFGTVLNFGRIDLYRYAGLVSNMIYNAGYFKNGKLAPDDSGVITMTHTGNNGNGILNLSGATFENFNEIYIDWVPNDAIINEGIFKSIGSTGASPVIPNITVRSAGDYGIEMNGDTEFLNIGGEIHLGAELGVLYERGIQINGGTITNRSVFNPSDPSNPLVAKLTVNGVKDWTGGPQYCYPIEILSGGTILNEGGVISVGDSEICEGHRLLWLADGGTLTNSCIVDGSYPNNPIIGTINLEEGEEGGFFCGGTFTNLGGVLNVGQTYGSVNYGIRIANGNLVINYNDVTNAANPVIGEINVDNALVGIEVIGGSTFENGGIVNIGQTGGAQNIENDGLFIKEESVYNNFFDGVLNIDNCGGNGIYGNDPAPMYIDGTVNVGMNGGPNNIQEEGIHIFSTLNTYNGSVINVQNSVLDGIRISRTATNNGTINISKVGGHGINCESNQVSFTNNHTIHIGENGPVGNYAIRMNNGAEFYNQSCNTSWIEVHSDNAIFHVNPGGNVQNRGVIIDNSSTQSKFGQNYGVILNQNGGDFTLSVGTALEWAGEIPDGKWWMGCNDSNWNFSNNWRGGIPDDTEDAHIFPTTTLPTISTSPIALAKSLTIYDNATLTNNVNYAGYSDIIIKNGGTLTGNGNYYLGEDWTNDGTFSAGTSTVTFNGPEAGTISGSSTDAFNDLNIDKYTNDAQVEVDSDISVTGDLTITKGDLKILSGNTVSGEILEIESNGTLTNVGTLDVTADFNIDGNLTNDGIAMGDHIVVQSNGTLINNSTFNVQEINIDGTLTNNGILDIERSIWNNNLVQGSGTYYCGLNWATFNGTFDGSNAKMIMDGSENAVIWNVNDPDIYDFEVNKSSGGTVNVEQNFDVLNQAVIQNGSLEILSGKNVNFNHLNIAVMGSIQINGSILLQGDMTNDGAYNSAPFSLMNVYGNMDQVIDGSNPIHFGRLFVTKPSGTLFLNADGEISNLLKLSSGNMKVNGLMEIQE